MSRRRRELEGRLACVTFAEPPLLAAFERELDVSVPLYGDPSRATYEAFGFERGTVRRVWLDPRVWKRYAELLRAGGRLRRSGQDTLQLGGDAVLDAEGRLRWIHRSRGPEDRPAPEVVIDEMRRAARGDR